MGAWTPYHPPPTTTSTTSTPKGLYRFTIQYNKQGLLHVRLEESLMHPWVCVGVGVNLHFNLPTLNNNYKTARMFAGRWRGVARLSNACCIAVTRWTAVRVCVCVLVPIYMLVQQSRTAAPDQSAVCHWRASSGEQHYRETTFCFNARPPPPYTQGSRALDLTPVAALSCENFRLNPDATKHEWQRDTYSTLRLNRTLFKFALMGVMIFCFWRLLCTELSSGGSV